MRLIMNGCPGEDESRGGREQRRGGEKGGMKRGRSEAEMSEEQERRSSIEGERDMHRPILCSPFIPAGSFVKLNCSRGRSSKACVWIGSQIDLPAGGLSVGGVGSACQPRHISSGCS
ncbi:unnamed protein product [Pleuronectes platessa]|uniref:Uncharacterized protein n=1 Tax=Pleuronectes platessa TaxID=8262 RepID=A0A9N7Y2Y1_PLEPL|nr:unnamed protein product [Pleuronectes platessa]